MKEVPGGVGVSGDGPPGELIGESLPCVKCWYDLKSLKRTARCPECGTPVSRTLRSLFASDLGFLGLLRRRLRWLLAIPILVVLLCVVGLLFAPDRVLYRSGAIRLDASHSMLLALPLLIRLAVLMSQVIRPEGRVPRVERIKQSVHPTLANWLFGYSAGVFVGGLALMLSHRAPGFDVTVIVAACAASCLWVPRNILLAPHLRRMCRRLGMKPAGRAPWLAAVAVAGCVIASVGAFEGVDVPAVAVGQFFVASAVVSVGFACGSLRIILWRCERRVGHVIRGRKS
ncbi:MAG: hypothetical protein ACKVZJ_12020 [Phycisphaerales bacterium]